MSGSGTSTSRRRNAEDWVPHLQEKIGHLERDQAAIRSALESVQAGQMAHQSDLKALARKFDEGLASALEKTRRPTDWRALAAWASVILAIGAISTASYVRDLRRLEEDQRRAAAEASHARGRSQAQMQREMEFRDEIEQARFAVLKAQLDAICGVIPAKDER